MPNGPTTFEITNEMNRSNQAAPPPVVQQSSGEEIKMDQRTPMGLNRAEPYSIDNDPTTREYLRKARGGAAAARQAIAKQRAKVELGRDRKLEDYGIAEERGLRSVNDRFESRGLLRSGRADLARNELAGDIERERARYLMDLQEAFDELDKRSAGVGAGLSGRLAAIKDSGRRQYLWDQAGKGNIVNTRQFRGQS